MKKSLLTSIFTLAMIVLTGHTWGEVIYKNTLAGYNTSLTLDEGTVYLATAFSESTDLSTMSSTADSTLAGWGGIFQPSTYIATHSVSGWFKVDAERSAAVVLWAANNNHPNLGGYSVQLTTAGAIQMGRTTANDGSTFESGNSVATADGVIADGNWHFIAMTFSWADGNKLTPLLYVDGNTVAFTDTTKTITCGLNGPQSCTNFKIGSGVTAAGVKVYNEAITAAAVAADYADRTNLTAAPTAIIWTGAADDGAWSNVFNWEGGAVPSSSDNVEFDLEEALTITIPDDGVTVDYVTVKGAKLTLAGGKLTTGDLVVSSELEAPVACIEAPNVILDSDVVFTLDAGTTDVGRTMKISGGTVIKKGSALLTLYQSAYGVEYSIFDGTTVQIKQGNLKLEIGNGQDPWIKNTTFDFADGTALQQYGWVHGVGTITLNAAEGVAATAFESNLAEQCILKKTGAGKVTANILGTGPEAYPNARISELQLVEGTLTLTKGTFTAKVTTAADTTLEFTGDAAIENTANNIGGLLKVTSGTVTHNGVSKGVNSFEIAEGAQLTSSAADGMNYNATTTATIDGTLYLKNRWTIFASNAIYLSGTLASDDEDFDGHYCAFDFYNNANNDNNHTKLYVTGPDAQITGRWGAHDSSKTLDVVFNSNDAKLTISKAPTAYQHVTTMLGDGIDSGALAVNFEVVTEKLLTIASGVTLSGTGTWGGPLALNAGAIVDATAGALTVGGNVTFGESLTVKLANAPAVKKSLPVLTKTGLTAGDVANVELSVVVNGTTADADPYKLVATDTGYVAAVDYAVALTVGDVTTGYATFAAAYGAATVNDTADTITLLADYDATADTSVLVQKTILYLGSETIDLNGYTLTAPVLLGTIAMNGGSFKTYDYSTGTAVLYTMAGPDSDVFRTTDGVFDIQATDDGSSITALSGKLTVASTYTSSEDQELIANEEATIEIPEDVTLTLMGNATVEGTLNCSGSIVLGAADAKLTTSTELGDKISTTVNDKVVVYANGVYSVGEAAAPTATPWASATVTAGSADAALAMVTLAVEVPKINGTAIDGLDPDTYLGYFTKKAVDNGDGKFTVKAVLNADAVRPQIATTEGAFVITKDEDGAVSKVAITISNPKKGLCYGIRVKNELSATATSDEIISLIPFSGSSDGTLTVEMDAVEDDVTAMAADAAFFTVLVEPPGAADTVTTTGEGEGE